MNNLIRITSFIICSIMFLEVSGQNSKKFTISGSVNPVYNSSEIMLKSYDLYDSLIYSSTAEVKNGKFTFKGDETLQGISTLTIGDLYASFFLEKGKIVAVLDDNPQVSGTPFNDSYNKYRDGDNVLGDKIEKLLPSTNRINISFESGSDLEKLYNSWGEYRRNFKKENISNILGQTLLLRELERMPEMFYIAINKLYVDKMYDFVPKELMDHPKMVAYKNRIKAMMPDLN